MSEPPDITEPRKNVHQGLGRALLRFQHLEQTLKNLVLPRFVSVAPTDIATAFNKRQDDVRSSPLGWLKEELLGKLVRPQGVEPDETEIDRAERKGHMAFRFFLSVPVEEHARIEHHLTVVHERRNHVVHHFLDAFDLQTMANCEAAAAYLDETHGLLDTHQNQVVDFARWAMQGLAQVAQAMQGPEFSAALLGTPTSPESKSPKSKGPRRRSKKSGGRPAPN